MAYILCRLDWLGRGPGTLEGGWGEVLRGLALHCHRLGAVLTAAASGGLGRRGQSTGQKAKPGNYSNLTVFTKACEKANLPRIVLFPGSASCLDHKLWGASVWGGMAERPNIEPFLP